MMSNTFVQNIDGAQLAKMMSSYYFEIVACQIDIYKGPIVEYRVLKQTPNQIKFNLNGNLDCQFAIDKFLFNCDIIYQEEYETSLKFKDVAKTFLDTLKQKMLLNESIVFQGLNKNITISQKNAENQLCFTATVDVEKVISTYMISNENVCQKFIELYESFFVGQRFEYSYSMCKEVHHLKTKM